MLRRFCSSVRLFVFLLRLTARVAMLDLFVCVEAASCFSTLIVQCLKTAITSDGDRHISSTLLMIGMVINSLFSCLLVDDFARRPLTTLICTKEMGALHFESPCGIFIAYRKTLLCILSH